MTLDQRAQSRIWVYTISGSLMFATAVLLQQSAYRGSSQLHTLMEVVATLTALIVGTVALVRYYSKKDCMYLFVSLGFLGTALLDSYHCLVTSTFFQENLPSPAPSLMSWSWNASRSFLAILLFLSWWVWKREQKQGKAGQTSARNILVVTSALAILSFCFYAFIPLARSFYPEFFFGRPQEFVAGVFFLFAFIGYARKGEWQHDTFEFWLLMSLLVGLFCQVAFMSRSFAPFDSMFDMAHIMKVLSYMLVLVGLLIGMYKLYSHSLNMLHETKETQNQFELLIEESPLAMVMINQHREIVLVNSEVTNCFGFSKEELLGELIEILLPSRYREKHPQQVASFFTDRKSRQLDTGRDLIGLHKDGYEFFIEIFINFVQSHQDGPVAICSVVDISERKKAQAALARQSEELLRSVEALARVNSELEQFAYVASHDLQEPLRKVASCCKMLEDDYADKLDQDGRMWITYAIDGATRMRQLVSDLLDFSRIGTLGNDPEPTDAHRACQEALYNLSDSIEQHKAQIVCRPLPEVLADKPQLIRLFQNLIGNSIKYCSEEQAVIEIGAERVGPDWRFYVKDNGIGIDPEYHARIFQVFQRLHLKEEYSGTGIGLATCKKIVERLGGELWVESQVDQGSTFYFTMSAVDSNYHEENQSRGAQDLETFNNKTHDTSIRDSDR